MEEALDGGISGRRSAPFGSGYHAGHFPAAADAACAHAAQMPGGITVPLYEDAVGAEMVFALQDAEIRIAIGEDQERVGKMLEVREQCHYIRSKWPRFPTSSWVKT